MYIFFLFIYLQCQKCNEKLTKLKGGAVQISPAEKDRVNLHYSKCFKDAYKTILKFYKKKV